MLRRVMDSNHRHAGFQDNPNPTAHLKLIASCAMWDSKAPLLHDPFNHGNPNFYRPSVPSVGGCVFRLCNQHLQTWCYMFRWRMLWIHNDSIARTKNKINHSGKSINLVAIDGIEPSSQLYESCILPLNYIASQQRRFNFTHCQAWSMKSVYQEEKQEGTKNVPRR